ncbi:MAG: hypothetical protein CMB99_11290 [Flavobacteriaceae bacterium]|nr:hypothetical protein [Flavobacteriaceae bacterium]|tara:strand:+ start:62731 stop:63435 length:705 start_codon:yes stop_codon:yes gene_type:complete
MVKEKFLKILDKEEAIKAVETAELKSIINQYPYFQAARALYLKGLKNQDHFRYNNELKKTAAHTIDRSILFEYITSENFDQKQHIQEVISQKVSEEQTPSENEAPQKELSIGKPINFKTTDSYSFHQWLQLSTKPIAKKTTDAKSEKEQLIDTFISTNPKIEPLSKHSNVSVEVAKNEENHQLMTETLAKVYLEQKKYENAIQAYRILSLKYPEKSGFFADQIKRIEILQKHKS